MLAFWLHRDRGLHVVPRKMPEGVGDSIREVEGHQSCSALYAFFNEVIDAENFFIQSEQCIRT
jgi:hypothetical protein